MNTVNLSEMYNLNNRSWSNSRGYGNVQFATDCQYLNSCYHKLRPLNAPFETNVIPNSAWCVNPSPQIVETMSRTCNLTPRNDYSPCVPLRANDFDLAGFKCLG